MKTLKDYCIFHHPHEQHCQIEIDDVKDWLKSKPHHYIIEELIEELNQC